MHGLPQLEAPAGSGRRWRQPAAWALSILLFLGGLASPVVAEGAGELGGIELTAPVRQQLYRLQQSWLGWTKAFASSDAETAAAQLEQMQLIAEHLGMSRLPDLSNAAAALAIREAKAGRETKAREALRAARQLDSERPENEFAEAVLRRQTGDFPGAAFAVVKGYYKLLSMQVERTLWLHNVMLWGLYTLLAASVFFLVMLMLVNGRRLFYDLSRLYSPPLSSVGADALTAVLLIWPIVLPSGFMWLSLYWSILLWSYVSRSTRGVMIFTWVLLGLAPSLLIHQQRSTRVAMVPAARLIENLAAGRLYGALFSDLEVLRSLVPDSDAVTEITADLHRRLGQWDYARAIYTELAQNPERPRVLTATAYCNIGVYHHHKGDYETAVNYFTRATEADPNLAEAFFDLSQAYGQLYNFNRQHEVMAQAKEIDQEQVEAWNDAAATAEDTVVPVDGGVRRVDELRQRISDLWRRSGSSSSWLTLWARFRALSVAFATLALALALDQLRRQVGFFSDRMERPDNPLVDSSWARTLLPGLASLNDGRGISAFVGIWIPVSFAMISLGRGLGYRQPLAIAPSPGWAAALSLALLALVFVFRLIGELRDRD